ncbi:hypothetical protein DDI_4067 [Dickeya dianthicola RNS04.9]|nr:hypothetical protein DDI_4067 [Dickeya dianthicola RNS04.9]
MPAHQRRSYKKSRPEERDLLFRPSRRRAHIRTASWRC